MPRVKSFEELPQWLQGRLGRDWEDLCHDGMPPIGGPEYRVHRIGDSGWWAVDAGAGGVTIERSGESHAYADLPEGELKALVDADGRMTRDADNVERVCEVILSHAVDPRMLGGHVARLRERGCTDPDLLEALVALLQEGLRTGHWLIG